MGRAIGLEAHSSLFAPTVDDVDKPGFGVVKLKKYPIHVMHDAVEHGIVAVVSLADSGLACDDFAKPVEVVPERVRWANSEPRFDVGGDPIRVVNEAVGINDAAHGEG